MKRLVLWSLGAAVLFGMVGCQQQEKKAQLTSKVNLPDGTLAYLRDLSKENADYVDTTKVMGGEIVFKRQEPDGLYGIEVQMNFWPVYLSSTPVAVDATVTPRKYEGANTELFNAYAAVEADYEKELVPLKDEQRKLEQGEITPEVEARLKELDGKVDALTSQFKEKVYPIIKQYPNNLYALNLFQILDIKDEKQMKDFADWLATWQPTYNDHILMKQVREYIDIETRLQRNKPFVDIAGVSMTGDSVHLSEFAGKGKPILVEVWASWCKGCLQGMPALFDIYNKYKAKGLEIFCVSVDQSADAWKEAVTKLGMPWKTNYVYTEMMDPNSPMRRYNSLGLPINVLIDGKGKIVGRSMPHEEIDTRLDMIFNMPAGMDVMWE